MSRSKTLLTLVLLGGAATAHSHSLSPNEINVKSINDFTKFQITAGTHFDTYSAYTTEIVSETADFTPIAGAVARPTDFKLQPGQKQTIRVAIPTALPEAYVCTVLTPGPGEQEMFKTRVCSRINLHHFTRQEH